MDRTQAKRIVDRYLRALRCALQLNDWQIDIVWGHIDDDRATGNWQIRGKCRVKPEYLRAQIELDDATFDTEADLLDVLRHEMFHIFHADLYLFKEQAFVQVSETAKEAMELAWQKGVESLVLHVERMMDCGLGMLPLAMAARASEYVRRRRDFEKTGAIRRPVKRSK